MKRKLTIVMAFFLGLALPLFAQSPMAPSILQQPFFHWPALYSAAEGLAIKRGVSVDGTVNDKLYLRIGWGDCLAVYLGEWDALVAGAQQDRYINMREWATDNLGKDAQGVAQTWGPDDDINCPDDPGDGTVVTDYIFGGTG
jgi:hypothetical protein